MGPGGAGAPRRVKPEPEPEQPEPCTHIIGHGPDRSPAATPESLPNASITHAPMAAPHQHKPGTGTSSCLLCCVLLVVGLFCPVQEPEKPSKPPPPPSLPKPSPLARKAPARDRPLEPRRTPGLPGPTKIALLQRARERATKGAVTLVVAGHAHLELLLNWLVAYERHSSNWVIGCLDTALAAFLQERRIPCVLVPNQSGPLVPGLRLQERARSAARRRN